MTLGWSGQRVTIADMKHWRRKHSKIPTARGITYAANDIQIARRDAAGARSRRRTRLAKQLAIAIGWKAP